MAWLVAGWLVVSVRLSAPDDAVDARAIESRTPARAATLPAPLELDRMSPRELRVLPGIGEARALAIARACWERGHLSVGDLDSIPSIGEATVARVRAWLARMEADP